MVDLISAVITLRPLAAPAALNETALPTWWGRAAHSLLLRLVRTADEDQAAALHDDAPLRPFTTSTLMGRFPQGQLDPLGDYTLRFTGLNDSVSSVLTHSLSLGGELAPGQIIELDYRPFVVQHVTLDASQHPWAAVAQYNDLAAAHLVGEPPSRHLTLQLTSPTQFHSQDRTNPLPLPELVFGSLADRWNSFAPITFPAEVKRYAAECLVINRFDLSSRAVTLKNGGKRIGAVGTVTYTTLNYDRYWMSLIHTLTAFALFAGIGAGVTAGLGQARSA